MFETTRGMIKSHCSQFGEIKKSLLKSECNLSIWLSYNMLSRFSRVRLFVTPDCSPPGSCVHGILQARILEWIVNPSLGFFTTQGSSSSLSCLHALASRFFTTSTTWEALGCSSGWKRTWVTEWGVHLGWPGWSTASPRKVKKIIFPEVSGKAQRREHCAS